MNLHLHLHLHASRQTLTTRFESGFLCCLKDGEKLGFALVAFSGFCTHPPQGEEGHFVRCEGREGIVNVNVCICISGMALDIYSDDFESV